MIRFALRCAFWLGLVAFFLPSTADDEPASAELSAMPVPTGARQALGDLGSFCARAPQACEAGWDLAAFASERIGAPPVSSDDPVARLVERAAAFAARHKETAIAEIRDPAVPTPRPDRG